MLAALNIGCFMPFTQKVSSLLLKGIYNVRLIINIE